MEKSELLTRFIVRLDGHAGRLGDAIRCAVAESATTTAMAPMTDGVVIPLPLAIVKNIVFKFKTCSKKTSNEVVRTTNTIQALPLS